MYLDEGRVVADVHSGPMGGDKTLSSRVILVRCTCRVGMNARRAAADGGPASQGDIQLVIIWKIYVYVSTGLSEQESGQDIKIILPCLLLYLSPIIPG